MMGLIAFCAGASLSFANEENIAGRQLRDSYIWAGDGSAAKGWLHAGFRRDFEISGAPRSATISLFAYTRYMLFVNGDYVGRGPNRYENRRPEYDTWDITRFLKSGRNVVSVIVHRDWPGETHGFPQSLARMRIHDPGFTARIEWTDADQSTHSILTDEQWAGFIEPTFDDPHGYHYSSIPETIDARKSPGDWHSSDYDASKLPRAKRVDSSDAAKFPELQIRTIPHLRETPVAFEPQGSTVLEKNQTLVLTCPRVVQAYLILDIEADAGAIIQTTNDNRYTTRAGKQTWIGGDTFGTKTFTIKVIEGKATITPRSIIEVIYPFDLVGKFKTSDQTLDHIWSITASSLQLMSEDAYTDCADRERSEWMDCDPPMFDATRVMMSGPDNTWSDSRLYKNLLLRVALSQQASGCVEARTCSEVHDVHTIMEDRACEWLSGIRKYYQCTGDKEFVKLIWPYARRQIEWFLDRRTDTGLVKAREWVTWDNPLRYATCEGTALNAFVIRAIEDSAYIADQIGETEDARRYTETAEKMKTIFNHLLWNETEGCYFAGHGKPDILKDSAWIRKETGLKTIGDLIEPTYHANLFAIDRNIVPPDRRERVIQYLRAHEAQATGFMSQYYYCKVLYSIGTAEADLAALNRIRDHWSAMASAPEQTTWEMPTGGSKMHCYGITAGYILSTYVLGVRRDAPVWERSILIEPHLGDLKKTEGIVVTEFGPVNVSWTKNGKNLEYKITVPDDVTATLIPTHDSLPIKLTAGENHGAIPLPAQ